MQLTLKISKYLLLLLAAIAVAAVLLVETGYFKGVIKGILTSQLGPLTGGSFTVEKLSGNVFKSVALEGVRLAGAGGQFFYAERIDISYFLPALLARRLVFTDVVISKPVLSLVQDPAGRWSGEGLFPSSKTSRKGNGGISVTLGKLRVNDGSFLMKYLDKPATLDVTGIYLSASAGIKGGAADISISSMSASGRQPKLALKDLSGKVTVKNSDISIKGLRISTEYSMANIDGTITDMNNPVFDIRADCPEISLKDINALAPGIRPIGAISSIIRVTGGLNELKVSQSLEYYSLKMNNEAVLRAQVPSILLNSSIRGLRPCDIIPVFAAYERSSCPSGELSLDVRAYATGRDIDEFRSSIDVITHPSSFAGSIVGESALNASIGKRLASLEGKLLISNEEYLISGLGYAGEKTFRLDKLDIESDRLSLASKGVFGYGKNDPLDMNFNLRSEDLGFISVFLPAVKIEGMITSTGSLKGTMGLPGIAAELDGRDLLFSGLGADSVNAKIALTGLKLMPEGTADILIEGFHGGGMVFDKLNVHTENMQDTERIEISAERAPYLKIAAGAGVKEKAPGIYSMDINKLSISGSTSIWSNDGDIKLEASAKYLRVGTLRMSNGEQSVSAKGMIGLVQNMGLKISVKNVDIESISELAGLDKQLGGNISAELGLEGSYLSPRISGVADITNAAVGGVTFDRIPAELNYAEKTLRFEAHMEKDGGRIFTAEGVFPVDLSFVPVRERVPRKGLRASVKSAGLGLDIIPALTEQVKSASGLLRADIILSGDPQAPQLNGSIDISGGTLTLMATMAEYRDINASIALNGSEAVLNQFALKSGNGSAELTGKIMLNGFVPRDCELELICRGFNIMNTELFTGNINSDIKIQGLYAAGEITVTQGAVNIPSRSKIEISEIEYVKSAPGGGTVTVPSAAEDSTFYKNLMLDLRLLVPGKTWIYGQGITAEINGDLNITKKRGGPASYSGEIDVTRGSYKIKERTLTIDEGKLVPRGADIMTSFISAKASCRIGDADIDVILGGTLDNPVITFQSNPPMERSDILGYLAFGAPSNKLSQSQSVGLRGTSFDALAGLAENDIKGVVGKVVPIDELTLKPSDGSWGVGKHITDKLFAKYEWRSGQDESPQTVLDYMLDRHFSLNSQLGNQKTAGVDLFWKYGY